MHILILLFRGAFVDSVITALVMQLEPIESLVVDVGSNSVLYRYILYLPYFERTSFPVNQNCTVFLYGGESLGYYPFQALAQCQYY